MNVATQVPSSQQVLALRPLCPSELAGAEPACLSWLWHGYLARGRLTALISPPKSGKTTLIAHLLARCAQGGKLAGLDVAPARRAIVVTEESTADWDARCRTLAIAANVQFIARPFQGARPTEPQWFALVAGLAALHQQEPVDLLVIDTLAALLPGYAETCAPKLLDCVLPLQHLANLGPSVCLLHHPAKGRRLAAGQASRGTIALPGFADIVLEMTWYRRSRRDRRRRICGYSRYAETPRHLVLELNADAADYTVRTDAAGAVLVQTSPDLRSILEDASDKLTLQTILERSTLSRWLQRAVQQGAICRDGTGHAGDSFRYWLPGNEPYLWPGSYATFEEQEAWRERRHVRAVQRDTQARSA
jgi:hypothetical protein